MTDHTLTSEVTTLNPILVNLGICDLCGSCIGVCPVDCIEMSGSGVSIIAEDCIQCWLCIPACPLGALEKGE
ncbi:4Fe-4S binding protein [bacterium]|nr:4Fe-4S binding protein [bacterium]